MEKLVADPGHSLIAQSVCASESVTTTHGDGFGLGWYGERETPGLYREIRPAWSDENLRSICAQVRSRLFFAHVRASTGTASVRANCHPFAYNQHMFMHNGQIGGYLAVKRRIEDLIPDDLYAHRHGTTDSEAIFLAALGAGLEDDPLRAMATTLKRIAGLMQAAHVNEPLRLTAALSDGASLRAFRWASDGRPPSLYWRKNAGAITVVSEPLDDDRCCWQEVPNGSVLTAQACGEVRIESLCQAFAKAA
jgi:glutamine amidotransferase